MITKIPETFVWAFIVSVTLNVALPIIIAGMAHSWGVTKGRLSTFEEMVKQSKVAHIDASFGRKHD